MKLILLLGMLLGYTAQACAAPNAPLTSATISDTGARAWSVYRNSNGDSVLVFIAPRDADPSASQRFEAALPGMAQAMRSLGKRDPLAIASLDDRVYLVYPAVYANSTRLMRVYGARAMPNNVGGLWTINPPGRLDAHAPIQTKGELVGFQSTSGALYALIREDSKPSLLRLDGNAWTTVPLPESLSTRRLDLVSIGEQIVLVDRSGPVFHAQAFDEENQEWSALPDALPIGLHTQLMPSGRAIGVLDWDEADLARLRLWSDAGVFTIASDASLPRDARYALLDSSETLLGMRMLPEEVDPDADSQSMRTTTSTVEVIEYDATNLTLRYRGEPITSPPVSAEEFRFLVGMMVLIMLGVLVVVILPDRSDAMRIPEACILADPGRRLIATMLDAVIVASAVGWVFGVSASEILTLAVVFRPDNAWGVIPATMICGLLLSGLFEWLLGATPGKLLMGIRVVRAQPESVERPKLWSTMARNTIKWILPPVAALALIDPESLHRGDRASRTLVVMPRPFQPPSTDNEG